MVYLQWLGKFIKYGVGIAEMLPSNSDSIPCLPLQFKGKENEIESYS